MDAALEAVVLERSSFEFMNAHEHQFDDHLVRNFMDSALNLEPGGDSSKVRSGQVASHKGTLSPQTVHALNERWAQTLATNFDLIDYAELPRSLSPLMPNRRQASHSDNPIDLRGASCHCTGWLIQRPKLFERKDSSAIRHEGANSLALANGAR